MPWSLFNLQLYLKRGSDTEFSFEFCNIFKNRFFTEELCMTASILRQLLTLYFAIIYNRQLSRSEKSLVRKKAHLIYFKDLTNLDFFYRDTIFYFLWQMLVYIVGYAKSMLYSEQPTVLLSRRQLNTMLLTNFEKI